MKGSGTVQQAAQRSKVSSLLLGVLSPPAPLALSPDQEDNHHLPNLSSVALGWLLLHHLLVHQQLITPAWCLWCKLVIWYIIINSDRQRKSWSCVPIVTRYVDVKCLIIQSSQKLQIGWILNITHILYITHNICIYHQIQMLTVICYQSTCFVAR